jgi:hypothetical protein
MLVLDKIFEGIDIDDDRIEHILTESVILWR